MLSRTGGPKRRARLESHCPLVFLCITPAQCSALCSGRFCSLPVALSWWGLSMPHHHLAGQLGQPYKNSPLPVFFTYFACSHSIYYERLLRACLHTPHHMQYTIPSKASGAMQNIDCTAIQALRIWLKMHTKM